MKKSFLSKSADNLKMPVMIEKHKKINSCFNNQEIDKITMEITLLSITLKCIKSIEISIHNLDLKINLLRAEVKKNSLLIFKATNFDSKSEHIYDEVPDENISCFSWLRKLFGNSQTNRI